MILTFCGTTLGEAAAVCWARCSAAAALATSHPMLAGTVAQFIDSHFPLIHRASSDPTAPVVYNLFPERQESYAETLRTSWLDSVHAAITDVRCTNTSLVARVLQKGAPHVGSVRYIGAQLQRACTTVSDQADHKLLQDILCSCTLGTWSRRPSVIPKLRYAAWRETSAMRYFRCAAHLKSSDVQFCIAKFIKGIASMDIGAGYTLRHRRGFPNLLTLTALERAAGPGPMGWPRYGFARCVDPTGKLFDELQPSESGAPPSAKKVKAAYLRHYTPELAASVRAVSHKALSLCGAPLTEEEHRHQTTALKRFFALVCTSCGTWRTRPRGAHKTGPVTGVLVDLNRSIVTCSGCGSDRVYRVLVNGYQLGHRGLWGALCSRCGDFGTKRQQHNSFSYCGPCFSVVVATTDERCGCGAPASTSHLSKTHDRHTETPTCAVHALWSVA